MEHNIGAGGVILNRKNQVLLVTNGKMLWGFPKGKQEPGENFLETAKREIREETGITDLTLIEDLGGYRRTQLNEDGSENNNIMKTIHMFLFKTSQKDLKPFDKDIGETRWVDKERVIELLQHRKDKEFFEKIKNKL